MPESSPLGRALVVRPRRRGYKHRPIIAVVAGLGMTESGELVRNLPLFATSSEPHVWVTFDVLTVALPLKEAFSHTDWFTWDFADSRDPEVGEGYMSKARLTSFGFDCKMPDGSRRNPPPGIRKQARHVIWEPTRMFSDPSTAADNLTNTHAELMRFALDVRAWCEEQNLPLRSTLPGLSAMLLRDPRFWPHDRGRVPRATNEAIRQFLPGVYQRRLAPTHRRIPSAVVLDQRRAYHRAAREVSTPDPTTLYARGYYADPENAPELWAEPGDELYERTIGQPGLVAVRVASSRHARKHELRLPAVDKSHATDTIYLWTNEVPFAEATGLKIDGIVAAWTSLEADTGLPLYGSWAESEIDRSSEYRRFWLKPTLHATYGLLGSRQRVMIRSSRFGKGTPSVYLIDAEPFPVIERKPHVGSSPLTNVTMLGVLQSEIRQRSLIMANELLDRRVGVYHVHADGLHAGPMQLPLTADSWTMDGVTNLIYEDDVSWTTDQRDVLPGRDARLRVELRRHHARLQRIYGTGLPPAAPGDPDPSVLREAA
jgi:hypothetical protein